MSLSQEIEHTYLISLLREVSTESSREEGEFDEVAFDIERELYEADELIRLARDKNLSGWCGADWHVTAPAAVPRMIFESLSPDESRAFFEHDEHAFFKLCVLAVDGRPVEAIELTELYELLPEALTNLLPTRDAESTPDDDGPSP